MADSCKRLAVGGDKLDRLTILPINVLHQIQGHMSIEDAARMTVLSRTWRDVWASNPKLVIDMLCRKIFARNKIDIISSILLQHHGVIKTFHLDISRIEHSVVHEWILFLSGNGLTGLTLLNLNNVYAPYELPSYVYSVELEHLYLTNCIFRPPCSFRGFHKLKRVTLRRVAFELEDATSFIRMPNLERLDVVECSGLCSINLYVPKLLHLFFNGCGTDTLKFSTFMDCGKLETVGILSQEGVPLNRRDKALKWTNLLSSWPNISTLILDKYFLKFFASGAEVERLPMSLNRLRFLNFHNFDLNFEDQLSRLLCILRSSPNLQKLQFTLGPKKNGGMKEIANLLEGVDCRTDGLNNLQMLHIIYFHGSRAELCFVRFVLASAPLLQKTILSLSKLVSERRSLRISTELMQFPRASPKSQIICEPCTGK